jgi:RNA polymerase subunit RPABC4/transcription elongation factor Spt4
MSKEKCPICKKDVLDEDMVYNKQANADTCRKCKYLSDLDSEDPIYLEDRDPGDESKNS